MQVDLLGPLRVRVDDHEIDLGGPRSRALVARLALEEGRAVSASLLIDDLWGEDVPADATNALQSVVSRTRRRLPDGTLESTAAGYVLRCADVDAVVFERLATDGRVDEALALWRGAALADIGDLPFARAAAARLDERRLSTLESSLRLRVASGGDPALLGELSELTTAYPYRDGLWLLRLTALAAAGRANEALTAYEGLRATLAEDLGADPSPALQDLHVAILRGEHDTRRGHRSLPAPLSSFVGRDDAIEELQAALVDHRLVTLLGPGGAGKTRLAVETARAAIDRYEDVWLTELAPVTDGADIHEAILSAMGLLEVAVLDRGSSGARPDERTRLLDAVRDVDGLLLLDNCEHLVADVAVVAEEVLANAPRLRILATSREPLRLIGELGYQVSPLTMPGEADSVAQAMTHSAVQLFVLRAQTVDRSFVLDQDTLPAVREICARLDGQPLAIELAAARLRTLTATQVAARLSDRFRLLTGGSRTALPRHRTLRAVVEWSWDLLDDDERDLVERLAVFPGGATAESAAAMGTWPATEELLESLVDKSLLVPVRGDTTRFRMLETLREFGVERLVERGEAQAVREAHLDHFLAYAERLAPQLRDGRQLGAIAQLDAERGNLVAALRYAVDQRDRARAGRLVVLLAWYWTIRSQHEEASTWAEVVLTMPGEADPATEICLYALGATAVVFRGAGERADEDTQPWRPYVDRVIELWEAHHPQDPFVELILATVQYFDALGDRVLPETTDPWAAAAIGLMRMTVLDNAGRVTESVQLIESTIEGFRALGDRWGLATALSQRALVEAYDGDHDAALLSWQDAIVMLEELGADEDVDLAAMRVLSLRLATAEVADLPLLREQVERRLAHAHARGHRPGEILARLQLGAIAHVGGDDVSAVREYTWVLEHLDDSSTFGGGQLLASVGASLAVARAAVGDTEEARAGLARAMRVAVATRDMPVVAEVAVRHAVVTAADDPAQAALVLGAADAIRGRRDQLDRGTRELVSALTDRLGTDVLDSLRADGSRLTRDEAIAVAVDAIG